jgi:hypothetical protein
VRVCVSAVRDGAKHHQLTGGGASGAMRLVRYGMCACAWRGKTGPAGQKHAVRGTVVQYGGKVRTRDIIVGGGGRGGGVQRGVAQGDSMPLVPTSTLLASETRGSAHWSKEK